MAFRTLMTLIILLGPTIVMEAADKDEKTINVSYCDLIKNPESFFAKRIRVRAIYWSFFEGSHLGPPVCCDDGSNDRVIANFSADANLPHLVLKKIERAGASLVILVGTFDGAGTYGMFGKGFDLL